MEFANFVSLGQGSILGHIISIPLIFPTHFPPNLTLTIVIQHRVEVGPVIKNSLPMGQSGQGGDYQEGPIQIFLLDQVVDKGHCLNGFPKTHFISQDNVRSFGPGFDHPIDTVQLVTS